MIGNIGIQAISVPVLGCLSVGVATMLSGYTTSASIETKEPAQVTKDTDNVHERAEVRMKAVKFESQGEQIAGHLYLPKAVRIAKKNYCLRRQ